MRDFKANFLYLTPVLLLAIFVYWGVWNFSFVYDDFGHLVNNPSVHSLSPVHKFISDPEIFTGHRGGDVTWRPLASFAMSLSWALFGSHSGWHHLANLILHLVNICLVYFLVIKLFQKRWLSLITAAVFAVHPILVEAVSWISGQNTLIFATLFLLACLAVVSNWPKALGILFFGAALLVKESAVPGLLVLILLMNWEIFGERKFKWSLVVRRSWLYLAVTAGYLFIRFLLVPRLGNYDWGTFLIVPFTVAKYIQLIFWPSRLVVLDSELSSFGLLSGQFYVMATAGTLIILAIMTALFYFWKKNWREEFLGFFWFSIMILPFIQLIPTTGIVGTRALYIPIIGFLFGAIHLVWRICGKNTRRVWFIFVLTSILILAIMASYQNKLWRNGEVLWSAFLRINPNMHPAYSNLGFYYLNEGQNPQKALEISKQELEIWPKHDLAWINLAAAYGELGDYKKAEQEFFALLLEYPDNKSVLSNLLRMYRKRGVREGGVYGRVNVLNYSINIFSVDAGGYTAKILPDESGIFYSKLPQGNYLISVNGIESVNFKVTDGNWNRVIIEL